MASYRFPYRTLLILVSFSVLASCSVEKNTRSSRFYHGLTSRYNIYFNGLESYKAGVAKVNSGFRDDYSELLRIFEYSDPATVPMCLGDMERAVQKASKVISLKSITAKPEAGGDALPTEKEEEFMSRKEYNEWIDDCYLLMGKARLYKRDYELAKATLSYNISSTVDKDIRTESVIWLARVYNETGNYNESSRILNEIDPAKIGSKELRSDYFTTLADLYLKQKRYPEAIDPLGKAISNASGKKNRYRYTYLLAQLNEKTGNANAATTLYRQVVKMRPPYEVEFNARINIAGVFDLNTGNPEEVKKELRRMLKDFKNKEFKDQIYFALGNLSRKEGNVEEAIDYYRKSAAASVSNQNQKGKSYLAMAEYYFSRQDYLNSGKYYDSTASFLDPKYPDYKIIKATSLNLNALVSQLNIIQVEDSLQRVAKMNESERALLIAGIIENVRKEESEKQAGDTQADRFNLGQYYENERRFEDNIAQEGRWYFYNQAALAFGRTEFRRRWGERKLEDNWRRQNKARISVAQAGAISDENGQQLPDSAKAVAENMKPEYYLKNLPMNDSLLAVSDEKIANAYLEAGKIYKEKFDDSGKAIESFETLLGRYPGDELEPETYYNIYNVCREDNNPMAETYRQRLIEKYPDNEFTRIISDPEYYNKKMEALREAEKLYASAYEAYTREDFATAMAICDEAMKKFSRHELTPKFQLLKSYCVARISDEKTFKQELSKIIKSWPDTPEAARASEIIAYINKEIPELKVEEERQIAAEIYVDDKNTPQTFVLVILNPAFNVNQATFDVISYNIDNYTNNNYRTQGALVDDKYILMTVSGFNTLGEAMAYYNAFITDKVVRNSSGSKMMTFVIGKTNLETLAKDKNPERYRFFFNEKYLNGDNGR